MSEKLVEIFKETKFNLNISTPFLHAMIISSKQLKNKALFEQISNSIISILQLEYEISSDFLILSSALIYVSYYFNDLNSDIYIKYLIPKVYSNFSLISNEAFFSLKKTFIINQTNPNAQKFKTKYSRFYNKIVSSSILLIQNNITQKKQEKGNSNENNKNNKDEEESNAEIEIENIIYRNKLQLDKMKEFYKDEIIISSENWRIEAAYFALSLLYHDNLTMKDIRDILQIIMDGKKYITNLSYLLATLVPKVQIASAEWLNISKLVSTSSGFSKESVESLFYNLQIDPNISQNLMKIEDIKADLIKLINLTISQMAEKNCALPNDEYIDILHFIEKISLQIYS